MTRAIIFDMDDTLIQTQQAKFAAHKHTAKKFYNLNITDNHLHSLWGQPFNQMMPALYHGVDSFENLLKNYVSVTHQFPISPYEGAGECITHLHSLFPLGLLTAANRQLTDIAMNDAAIPLKLFTYIQTSDDTDYHKPNPRVFEPVLTHFGRQGIDKQDILYVGDRLDDLQSARGAGLEFIAIAGHTTDPKDFAAAGATYVEDFSSLIDLLS